MGAWKFLTLHAGALACIAMQPGARVRDIAAYLDITERATHKLISDLEADGYLTRHKVGTRNFYELHPERPLRHPAPADVTIGELLRLLGASSRAAPNAAAPPPERP